MSQPTTDPIAGIRTKFHRLWAESLSGRCAVTYRMPPASIAYESAWMGFLAGYRAGCPDPAGAAKPASEPTVERETASQQ